MCCRYNYLFGKEKFLLIYLFYLWVDEVVYLMDVMRRLISVLGLRRVVCNGFLMEVFWFLDGDR